MRVKHLRKFILDNIDEISIESEKRGFGLYLGAKKLSGAQRIAKIIIGSLDTEELVKYFSRCKVEYVYICDRSSFGIEIADTDKNIALMNSFFTTHDEDVYKFESKLLDTTLSK